MNEALYFLFRHPEPFISSKGTQVSGTWMERWQSLRTEVLTYASCSAGGVEIFDYYNVVGGSNGSFGPDVEVDTLLTVFSPCYAICPKNRRFLRAEGIDICASELVRGHLLVNY